MRNFSRYHVVAAALGVGAIGSLAMGIGQFSTPAPAPKNVARLRATSSNYFCGPPNVGEPSYVMICAPVSRMPASMFQTIQVVATA